jgi:hypothetical protein
MRITFSIEIPSSAERIWKSCFHQHRLLSEITFASERHVKQIAGVHECVSLFQRELPRSVKYVSCLGQCASLRIVVPEPGCRVRCNNGLRLPKPFLLHFDETGNSRGRLFHLDTQCFTSTREMHNFCRSADTLYSLDGPGGISEKSTRNANFETFFSESSRRF